MGCVDSRGDGGDPCRVAQFRKNPQDAKDHSGDVRWPIRSRLEFGRIGGIIGQQNASNRRMMNKKNAAQGFGVALATPLAIGATAVAYKAWPQLHVSLILIFIGLWAGLFKTVVWVFTRELPVAGAERRRRNKQFYDWLRSQGRR